MKASNRIPRSYKMEKTSYEKAMRRAKKDKIKLANFLETVANSYASGLDVYVDGFLVQDIYKQKVASISLK